MEVLKVDLEQDEVFVFTPKGDVVTLPAGATAVDFAYTIHTEVGHRCIGARVNGRLVPLDSALASGDTVEIFTSKVAGAGPLAGLAAVRPDAPGPVQDPPVVLPGAPGRRHPLDDFRFAADHQAVTSLGAPDAAAGAHIQVVHTPRAQLDAATDVVAVVRVATVDNGIAVYPAEATRQLTHCPPPLLAASSRSCAGAPVARRTRPAMLRRQRRHVLRPERPPGCGHRPRRCGPPVAGA